MAPDGISEVRHDVFTVLHLCRERGVSTPDVEGGRSLQAREGGPLLCQRRRDRKLGWLVLPVCARDGQGKDAGERGVGGDPQRWVGTTKTAISRLRRTY